MRYMVNFHNFHPNKPVIPKSASLTNRGGKEVVRFQAFGVWFYSKGFDTYHEAKQEMERLLRDGVIIPNPMEN